MKKTDKEAKDFSQYIEGRDVVEIACGSADFSVSAAKYAGKVLAADISPARIDKRKGRLPENVAFMQTDASALDIKDGEYGLVVFHNCFAHLEEVLADAVCEAARVVSKGGHILFISGWKLDMPYFPIIMEAARKIDSLSLTDTIKLKEYSAIVYRKLPK